MGFFKFLKSSSSSSTSSIKSNRDNNNNNSEYDGNGSRTRSGSGSGSIGPSSPAPSSISGSFSHRRNPQQQEFNTYSPSNRIRNDSTGIVNTHLHPNPSSSLRNFPTSNSSSIPSSPSSSSPTVPTITTTPSDQLIKRERRISSSSSVFSLASKLKLRSTPSKDKINSPPPLPEFKAVPYASVNTGRIPVMSESSKTMISAMREKVESGRELKLLNSNSNSEDRVYRIPSLHLEEDEEIGGSGGWGDLGVGSGFDGGGGGGGGGQHGNGNGHGHGNGVGLGLRGRRTRLDSVEEKEEIKHVKAMRGTAKTMVGGFGQEKEGAVAEAEAETVDVKEDDKPLGMISGNRIPRTKMSSLPPLPPASPEEPIQVVLDRPVLEDNHTINTNGNSIPHSQTQTQTHLRPKLLNAESGSGERRKSSFFGRMGSRADLRRESETSMNEKQSLNNMAIESSLLLEPPRSGSMRSPAFESNSEPGSPIVIGGGAYQQSLRPGHQRNGSEGSTRIPPSAWKAEVSPSMSNNTPLSGGTFPWSKSSAGNHGKSKEEAISPAGSPKVNKTSPTPSLYRSPSLSKSSPSLGLGGFIRGKGKSKEREKQATLLDGEDPSFQLRSFRHVSSAADESPWEVYNTFVAPKAISPASDLPPISVVKPPGSTPSSPGRSMTRPVLGASRRSSTYSLTEDGQPKQVPASVFKHRRTGSGPYTGPNLDWVKSEDEETDKEPPTPTKSVGEGQEVLVTPVKLRPEVDHGGRSTTPVPRLPRSHSTSALETLSSTSSDTLRQIPIHAAVRNNVNKGFVVSSRRSTSVSSTLSGFDNMENVMPNGRPGSAIGYSSPPMDTNRSMSPPLSDLPPRPASVMGFSVPTNFIKEQGNVVRPVLEIPPLSREWTASPSAISPTSARSANDSNSTISARPISPASLTTANLPRSDSRLTLSERLALAANVARPSSVAGSVDSAGVRPGLSQTRSESTVLHRRQEAEKTSPRRGSTVDVMEKSRKSGTWDLSSSDEDEKPGPAQIRQPVRPPTKARTESMPSGLRRPPAPSVAFGDKDGAVSYVPLKQPAEGSNQRRPAAARAPSSFQAGRRAAGVSSGESDDESEASSEEESLAAIRKKRSDQSLASNSRAAGSPASSRSASREDMGSRSKSGARAVPTAPSKLRMAADAPVRTPKSSATPPSAFSARSPSLPLLSTQKPIASMASVSPQTGPRHSPASSLSGTGDTSSSGLPVTPLDINSSSSDIALPVMVRGTSGERSGRDSLETGRNRRVSFMEDEAANAASMEKKRKDRRRVETKAAMELGSAMTAPESTVGEQKAPPPSSYNMSSYNPYFAGNVQANYMAPFQQQQQQQQQAMYAMQMAQMNPAYMHQMQQQAMAYAKYQYQASMAAAAMQAANEEWERASNVSGFNPAAMLAAANNNNGHSPTGMTFPPGVMGLAPPMASYRTGGSVYSASTNDLVGGQYPSSSASAAGSMYGPPTPNHPGLPRASSSGVLLNDARIGTRSTAGTPPRRQRQSSEQAERMARPGRVV